MMSVRYLSRLSPLLLILFLGACGIKGDLYLPPQQNETQAAPASETPEDL